jgi:uncharacterized membrane protein
MMERLISVTLRTGVLLSIATIVLGVALTFVHHPDYFHSRPTLGELTNAEAALPHTLGEVGRGIAAHRGQAIVMLGILLLIATPIVRVVISVAVFASERDWLYAAITLAVLTLLVVSLLS